jgi:glutamate-1-semialdehyde 2,1-aminomutase
VVCLAKAIGGGTPCGAIGATEELYGPVLRNEHDIAGTYNGNPLTMAASRAALKEVMTREVYPGFDHIDRFMKDGLTAVIEKHGLPCYVSGLGAKGSVIYSRQPVREYRDAVGIDERISYLAWLFQQNRGVFKSPWTKQETWTLSIEHTEADAQRYIDNFEEFASALAG